MQVERGGVRADRVSCKEDVGLGGDASVFGLNECVSSDFFSHKVGELGARRRRKARVVLWVFQMLHPDVKVGGWVFTS